MRFQSVTVLLICCWCSSILAGANRSVAGEVSSIKCQAGGDSNKTFFLMGPKSKQESPKKGYGLVLILPGGDGSAEFQPFVKNLYADSVPDDFLAVQPVAVKWTASQYTVWPTRTGKVQGQKFSTEDFIEAVIAEVGKKHPLDRRRVFTLSWSSSGPAAYATSMAEGPSVTGSFVAMSIFKPEPAAIERAKGHAYYIYHSPEDKVCLPWMARRAATMLEKAGAKVKLVEYAGGHGWHGDVFGDVQTGLRWLVENADKMESPATQASVQPPPANDRQQRPKPAKTN